MNKDDSKRLSPRPNIPRPPLRHSPSQSTSRKSLTPISSTTLRISKYEQYLYPQTFETLSSAAPLKASVIYPIDIAASQEEEDEIEASSSIYEKFERQRRKILQKYNTQADKSVIVVSLKSDRIKTQRPTSTENQNYYKLTGRSDDSSATSTNDMTEVETEMNEPDDFQSYENELVEYEMNDIWFDSVLLELDEIYPQFLNKIRNNGGESKRNDNTSGSNSPLKSPGSPKNEDEYFLLYEDPIQSAFATALKKQRENANYDEEEAAKARYSDGIMHKNLSAAELNRQWGFKDPEIGKYIAKFRKQFEDDHRKK